MINRGVVIFVYRVMNEMNEIDQPSRGKFYRIVSISFNTLGWMVIGLILGFGTMWVAGLFAYGNPVAVYDIWIILTVFGFVIIILAFLLRIQQRRQNTSVGDYWRLLISLILCMGVGAFSFFMIDSLVSLIPYY